MNAGAGTEIFSSILERVIQSPVGDAAEIAALLDGETRARLAVFCYARVHLREKGIAIAAECQPADIARESSSHVANQLLACVTEAATSDLKGKAREMTRISLPTLLRTAS
jgi:hypothetical protein